MSNDNSIYSAINNSTSETSTQSENINMFRIAIQKADTSSETYNSNTKWSNIKFSLLNKEEQEHFMSILNADVCALITQSITARSGSICIFSDIWELMHDEEYAKVTKKNRKVIYSYARTERPVGDNAFGGWNGLQIIDLDIKDTNIAVVIKDMLFNILSRYHWFVGITLSSSGNGIHVYTKIVPVSTNLVARKTEYYYNFQEKYAAVFSALECISYKLLNSASSLIKDTKKVEFTEMIHWIDTAMCRPQQGAFIPYCPTAELSTNFVAGTVGYNFNDDTIQNINSIIKTDKRLQEIFSRIKYFSDNDSDNYIKTEDIDIDATYDINQAKETHYKYNERWQIANTLVKLYGKDDAFTIMKKICSSTSRDELRGYINTATSHDKEISEWAVKELRNRHGFNINIKNDKLPELVDTTTNESAKDIISPVEQISSIEKEVTLTLKEGQYLSDIQDDIVAQMSDITILDAGAGFGKTEMVKHMPGRKMLVLPYTSIISSKIEADDTISSEWLSFYGSRKVTLQDLYGTNKSFVMTVDKFSNINIEDIKTAGFDTIWFDESHLMFISGYRDVMSPSIERLAQMPARGVKVVLMTGTPTGENLFFPKMNYVHIVRENDARKKDVNVFFSYKKQESDYNMCKKMAESIKNGKKILYPTNNGTRRFKQIIAKVQTILNEDNFGREINTFYYKKANSGTNDMKKINEKKSIGNNDIIGCTNFLSVGVDICDKFNFEVFFDEIFMPQDVEQFANRIRNNDLHINIFLKTFNAQGDAEDYTSEKPLDLTITQESMTKIYNLLRVCNDALKNNADDLKFNPIVSSIRRDNKYIVFDEDIPEYRVDWTTYKLHLFEDAYKKYSTQFPCFERAMKYYGYKFNMQTIDFKFTEDQRDKFNEEMNETKRVHVSQFTTEVFNILDTLDDNNIDIYINGLKDANFDLFRSDKYELDRVNNNIKVTDVEVLLKTIPYIKRLYTWYDPSTIKDIFKDNTDKKSNRINIKKIQRACDFILLETKRMKHQLDISNYAFIKAANDYALANPETTKIKIDNFINKWCCDRMNRVNNIVTFNPEIPEIVSGSKDFLEDMKKYFTKVWNTVVETTKVSRKTGAAFIKPFELNYDTKESFQEMFGDINLKLVLGDEFTHRMRGISIENDKDDTDINNLSNITKKTLAEYESEKVEAIYLSAIPADFSAPDSNSYYIYSEEDGSAKKFQEKQIRQHSDEATTNIITSVTNNSDETMIKKTNKHTLFDGITDFLETNSVEQIVSINDNYNNDNFINKENNQNETENKFTYNNEEDLQAGIDWDLIDQLGLCGDDGMSL